MSAAGTNLLGKFPEFYSHYHRDTPKDHPEAVDSTILMQAAAHHLNLGLTRLPNEILATVFTASESDQGWVGRDSIIQVVMPDMPFIVDSLTTALNKHTRGVLQVVHPILQVQRDEVGSLVDVGSGQPESWVEIVIRRLLLPEEHAEIEKLVLGVLKKVQIVTSAWRPIQTLLANQQFENASRTFVDWLLADNFTFMSVGIYAGKNLELIDGKSLGLVETLGQSIDPKSHQPGFAIRKSPERAEVHRDVYLDEITWVSADAKTGIQIVGLFGSNAYASPLLDIPLINQKVQSVLGASGFPTGSHSHKDLMQFLQAFPRDLLFRVDRDWLLKTSRVVLTRLDQRQTLVFLNRDTIGDFAEVVVYLPRDVVSTRIRVAIATQLKQKFQAIEVHSNIKLDENPTAMLDFQIRLGATSPVVPANEVRDLIQLLAKDWDTDFAEQVISNFGDDVASHNLLAVWATSFEENYKNDHAPDMALADVIMLDQLDEFGIDFKKLPAANMYSARIFSPHKPIALTTLMPMMDAFGIRVEAEFPYIFQTTSGSVYWIQELEFEWQAEISSETLIRLSDAGLRVLKGQLDADKLLSLILSSGLEINAVTALGMLRNYVAQWSIHSPASITAALLGNQTISAKLSDLFARQLNLDTLDFEQNFVDEILNLIAEVPSLEQDRILRSLLETIQASVRTNIYSQSDFNTTAAAIKFNPKLITQMPEPRPYAEVWVESPRVRGVHIRFGEVARGGLRWSDRPDDLRIEVMGLVRAQIVKNSVIVPTGAKGGFFPKRLETAGSRDEFMQIGVAAYQEFIRSLLSLTDNIVDKHIQPAAIRRRDKDDAYLVVAADKGTAAFSDYANAIAIDSGFWLGDAFASGGSNGYDHKAMGITARGAFESVRHHFALGGLDVEKDSFTVVGIGDMSGDVFGNGMLLSKSLKLIAAFDHRDIFLDPNPDSNKSWDERNRLFNLPRSSWADYDQKLISKGGGVFSRSLKSIPISQQVAEMLGIIEKSLTPNELISAILKAPVDLLWNGGIGTYVKSSRESHAAVGDKANDTIRVDSTELRCKVVGEGGNLGFTQAARVEAALAGVRINSDAIDNSAGVDTSDHEVNLKILLNSVANLNEESRNHLLRDLTDEVGIRVLEDNIQQNAVLTVAEYKSDEMASVHARLLENWSSNQVVDLELEGLPTPNELLERAQLGTGLVKPELGVLMSHVKLQLTEAILHSAIVKEKWAERYLFSYFPENLRDRFADEISNHQLRDQIIAMVAANDLVNIGGITAIWRIMEETNSDVAEAARAYLFGIEVSGVRELHAELNDFGWKSAAARIQATKELRRYQDRIARWLLSNRSSGQDLFEEFQGFEKVIKTVRTNLSDHLQGDELERWKIQVTKFESLGLNPILSRRVAGLLDEYAAMDLLDLKADVEFEKSSQIYFEISNLLAGDRILNLITQLPRDDVWQAKARAAMRADMYSAIVDIVGAVIRSRISISQWRTQHQIEISRLQSLVEEVEQLSVIDIAPLSVVLRNLRALVSQTSAYSN
jgi:glutamate dehydrogenase